MNEQKTEQWLKSAKLKQLSAEVDKRILDAIIAADASSSPHLWQRRIPIWQAAAACLTISVLTLLAAGMFNRDTTQKAQPNTPTPVALTQNKSKEPPPYLTDASKWKVLYISPEGSP